MNDYPRRLVQVGYDTIAERFASWINEIEGDPRERFLDEFDQRLAPGSAVLELGCGAGGSGQHRLASRHDVLGMDLSAAQVELARRAAPEARVVRGDMLELVYPPASWDAVLACYSILHLPRSEYAALFARIASWLRRGGLFLTALSAHDDPGTIEEDWIGAPMYFSGYPPQTNRRLLTEVGLEVVLDEPITMYEPEGAATFHWLLARLQGDPAQS